MRKDTHRVKRITGIIFFSFVLILSACGKSESESDQSSIVEGCNDPGSFPFSKPNPKKPRQKVVIDDSQLRAKSSLQSQATPFEVYVRKGSALSVAVDSSCFLKNGAGPFLEYIEDSVSLNWPKFLRGQRAYFAHKMTEDISYGQFLTWIDADECVLAVNTQRQMRPVAFPTDPNVGEQSQWEAIDFDAAYDDFFDGVNGVTTTVTVAVIDTGIDLDHEDLVGHIWANSDETDGDNDDDDGNGYDDDINGYHFVNDDGDPDPSGETSYTSHGTAVAGLIGAVDNSVGVVGLMSQYVEIMSLNVFGNLSSTTDAYIAEALDYAVANGANIVNMSIGGSGTTPTTEVALQNAVSGGVFVAIAAGNSGAEITSSNFFSPAGYAKDLNGVIAVGATNSFNLQTTYYSNYSSSYVELMAPGSIRTVANSTKGVYTLDYDDEYQYIDGTSFSSPIVAGAAALAWSLITSRGGTPTPSDIEEYIRTSGRRLVNLSRKSHDCRHLDMDSLYEAINADHP